MNKLKKLAGCGPLGGIFAVLILTASICIENKYEIPPLVGSYMLHIFISIMLLCIAIYIFFLSLQSLPFNKHRKNLVTIGPYACVRHPRYSALIFCVYPAIAIFLHSIISLISTPLVYIGFLFATKKEEEELIRVFGQEYIDYQKKIPRLIPRIIKEIKR